MSAPTMSSQAHAPPVGVPPLSAAQKEAFHRDGWLVLRGVLPEGKVAEVRAWMDEVTRWAEDGGPGLHHFEQTDDGPRIARSEDFTPYHPGLRALITEGAVPFWVGELFGEPALLFKEKCNYKYPGGGGFAPHQDAAAYRFVDHHISVMVPLDPATVESGCLYVAPGHVHGKLPTDGRGRIEEAAAEALDWRPAEVFPGDLLLFDSYAPHRSDPRRALYLTYNAASAGDFRAAYYADKNAEFEATGGTFGGERVRISVSDDFLGRPVAREAAHTPPPLEDLFARYAGERAQQLYDEDITELQHGLQAAVVAAADGAPDALVAAALLHDVGHLLLGDHFPIGEALPRDFRHEEVGARYLARWFSPDVTEPVALHVAAKRYLVATDPDYAATLTPSSVRSLEIQGGPMSAEEVAAFERRRGWKEAVKLRRYDDLAKDPAMETPPFASFEGILRRLAR